MHRFAELFPPCRLEVASGPVTLRVPGEDALGHLADALLAGALDDEQSRSSLAWQPTDRQTAARETIGHVTSKLLAGPGPSWHVPFAVFVDGEPLGRQDVTTVGPFDELHELSTGSWLVNTSRGRGYGTHARAAVLAFGFALGATRMVTTWRADNAASSAVAAKLGYVENGVDRIYDRLAGTAVELVRGAVTPQAFEAHWPRPVEVRGLDDDVRRWLHAME